MTKPYESDSKLSEAVLRARADMEALQLAETRRAAARGPVRRFLATQVVKHWENQVHDSEEHLDMLDEVRTYISSTQPLPTQPKPEIDK